MNNIKIFENEEFGSIRVTEINGEPWFVGKDVADKLGYLDTRKAVVMHVDEDDRTNRPITDALGRTQENKTQKNPVSFGASPQTTAGKFMKQLEFDTFNFFKVCHYFQRVAFHFT